MRPGDERPVDVAYRWWLDLTSRQTGAARGALARLRRANTPLEVLQEPEALRLIAMLGRRRSPQRAAMLAGVLAHVREDLDTPVARAAGPRTSAQPESAVLAESRFRRLLQSDEDERMEHIRRLVRMFKGTANVRGLAHAVLYWGDRVKQQWIFDYYGVALETPDTQEEHSP